MNLGAQGEGMKGNFDEQFDRGWRFISVGLSLLLIQMYSLPHVSHGRKFSQTDYRGYPGQLLWRRQWAGYGL
jgi:hypothetical protein